MDYNKLLLILYVITLAVILVEFFKIWGFAVTLMLILIIIIVQRINFEKAIDDMKKKRNQLIDIISERIDIFSERIESLRLDMNRDMVMIENRISELRNNQKAENERNYRELARKMFDIENKLNSVKKTLGAAFGSLDERVEQIEEKE
ncbi:MAG: hypothetical protein V1900_00170 [Candidatus Aenigmatarchaeota archaeon]